MADWDIPRAEDCWRAVAVHCGSLARGGTSSRALAEICLPCLGIPGVLQHGLALADGAADRRPAAAESLVSCEARR